MFKKRLRNIAGVKETPHKIALAFSIGLFVGISPLIGIHTVLGLALAWVLRLNRMVTLTGVYITNPWSMVPIYTFCTWIGMLIVGVDIVPSDINWSHVRMSTVLMEFRHIIVPFAVGSTVVGAASAFFAYLLTRKAVESARDNMADKTTGKSEC
jgi:uncharacterized protein (DUF2062 family)